MTIPYDDFAKLELKVATIRVADGTTEADLGAGGRQPVAGLEAGPATRLSDRQVVVVANAGTLSVEDVEKVGLRVATVEAVNPHPNADKLLVLQIDAGDEKRQICAGIKAYYTPEQLVGKQIVIVSNLEPRKLRGEVSQGMLLAATDEASGRVIVISPSEPVAAGTPIRAWTSAMLLTAGSGDLPVLASPSEPVGAGSGVK